MTDSNVYDNRELSWLKFNQRVLEEAQDVHVPLFERMRFISIFSWTWTNSLWSVSAHCMIRIW